MTQLKIITLFFLVIMTTITCAQSVDDWVSVKAKISDKVDSGDCAGAWDLIWPWAQRGSTEARAILAKGVAFNGLIPPGSYGDAISLYRHAVILAVYGVIDADSSTVKLLNKLIQTGPVLSIGGDKLKRCLNTANLARICTAQAIKSSFVPAFENYSREVNANAAIPGAPEASCYSGEKPQPLPVRKE